MDEFAIRDRNQGLVAIPRKVLSSVPRHRSSYIAYYDYVMKWIYCHATKSVIVEAPIEVAAKDQSKINIHVRSLYRQDSCACFFI